MLAPKSPQKLLIVQGFFFQEEELRKKLIYVSFDDMKMHQNEKNCIFIIYNDNYRSMVPKKILRNKRVNFLIKLVK